MGETVKHTPGPWFVSRKFEVGPRSDADDQSNGMIVALADVYGDNREANARLIAAAPELLAALKEAQRMVGAYVFLLERGGNETDAAHARYVERQIAETIAKAEGR